MGVISASMVTNGSLLACLCYWPCLKNSAKTKKDGVWSRRAVVRSTLRWLSTT